MDAKKIAIAKIRLLIEKFLNNECNYEFLEDYILSYAKNNKISINFDYLKARILDIYNIKGEV